MIVHQTGRWKGRKSGIADTRDWFQLWEVSPDKGVTRVREYDSREPAFQAARVQE